MGTVGTAMSLVGEESVLVKHLLLGKACYNMAALMNSLSENRIGFAKSVNLMEMEKLAASKSTCDVLTWMRETVESCRAVYKLIGPELVENEIRSVATVAVMGLRGGDWTWQNNSKWVVVTVRELAAVSDSRISNKLEPLQVNACQCNVDSLRSQLEQWSSFEHRIESSTDISADIGPNNGCAPAMGIIEENVFVDAKLEPESGPESKEAFVFDSVDNQSAWSDQGDELFEGLDKLFENGSSRAGTPKNTVAAHPFEPRLGPLPSELELPLDLELSAVIPDSLPVPRKRILSDIDVFDLVIGDDNGESSEPPPTKRQRTRLPLTTFVKHYCLNVKEFFSRDEMDEGMGTFTKTPSSSGKLAEEMIAWCAKTPNLGDLFVNKNGVKLQYKELKSKFRHAVSTLYGPNFNKDDTCTSAVRACLREQYEKAVRGELY